MKNSEFFRIGHLQTIMLIAVILALLTTAWGQRFPEGGTFCQAMSRRAMVNEAQRSQLIHAKLAELRVRSGASRAYVFLFHDGPWLSTGKPMTMMSLAYESAAGWLDTVSSLALIVSRCPAVLELLTHDAQPVIFSVANGDTGDLGFIGSLTETRYVVMQLIICNGLIVGWFGMDFQEHPGHYNSRLCSEVAIAVSRILGDSSGQ